MRLTFDGEVWVFQCTYEERFTAKEAGFRWDRNRKRWWTRYNQEKLRHYADASALAEFERLESNLHAPITVSEEGSLYPYQQAGIKQSIRFIEQTGGVLLADAMGLGKTAQAIGVMNHLKVKNALVICPASLKINWSRELTMWSTLDLSVGIANGEFPETNVVIINYEMLKKHHNRLRAKTWDIRIVDECHYIKNPKAARTSEVLGKFTNDKEVFPGIPAKARMFLSGTPIKNRPVELWPIIRALDPNGLGYSFLTFGRRYCAPAYNTFGTRFDGASNLDELQTRMRSRFMVRRTKEEVLPDLPEKTRQIIELPYHGSLVKQELQLQEAVDKAKNELLRSDGEFQDRCEALRDAQRYLFTEIASIRHKLALEKLPLAIEHITDILENGEKIVVFAHHKDVIDALCLEFPHVRVVGGMSPEAKQKAVDQFQNDPDCQLFIGNIQAAGVGLTLTASSHVIFVEEDWTPGNLEQAEDRCHRIGQKNSVTVQHLVFEDSLDCKMLRAIAQKQKNINRAMNGGNHGTISQR